MLGRINKIINTVKKIISNKIHDKLTDENKKYWQLYDGRDLPDKISTKTHFFYEDNFKDYVKDEIATYTQEFKDFFTNRFSKYIYEITDAIVDPDEHLALIEPKYIFRHSFPMMEDPWGVMQPRPSKRNFLSGNKNLQHLDKAILIKFCWTNYYHFLIDTLPQIALCDEYGFDIDIPIIVPPEFVKCTYAQDYFKQIYPIQRKIIVQENGQYFNVDKLYIAKDVYFCDYVLRLKDKVINDPETIKPEKIFIKRHKNFGRTITNLDEIEAILKELGYTVIEPGDYNIMQQMNIFSNAEDIIGIHGAALTNMVFSSKKNLRLIEIFKGGKEFADHYKNLAEALGFNYKMIAGAEPDAQNNFHLDKQILLNALKVENR